MKLPAKKVIVAAAAAKKKAQPVFDKSEHLAAISYAVMEFVHIHELVILASALLLLSFAVILFGRGLEMLFVAVGGSIAAM